MENQGKPFKRTIKTLTIAQSLSIIEQVEKYGRKVSEVAKDFSIAQSTVSTLFKQKEKWHRMGKLNVDKKRIRLVGNEKLERSMEMFVNQARENNLPLSGSILREKACEFAQKLGIPNFKGSSGWLSKFLKRQKMTFRKLCGESASVDLSVTDNWISQTLPSIIAEYDARDIYNTDETGLYYKCLPDKTFAFRSETCHGGKYSKQRLTVMCATNMDGSDKLPLLVIGKSKNPRCFKKKKSLPVIYESNTKVWMTSILFEKWIMQLDERFSKENRKVVMFVDNCIAHPKSLQPKR
ncbi:tigger transposable element-derived protein 4-like [Toxorhynchites rutilus septentrionalis]|uniref:tigger transposable element-derived protein 4-like n=1 Tax=Toxorhynchites rutilus septentrionalis TaxID=329112 RepID=UPI00247B06E3|nr:tigger transposable element-derived protein 4-like [Toxorhynchites rutilus septentrionalis]